MVGGGTTELTYRRPVRVARVAELNALSAVRSGDLLDANVNNTKIMFKPKDAEVDVENLKVTAVERRGKQTVIITEGSAEDEIWLRCTLDKHNNIVARFRKKLGLNASI